MPERRSRKRHGCLKRPVVPTKSSRQPRWMNHPRQSCISIKYLQKNNFWQTTWPLEVWDALHTVGLRSHFVASSYAISLMLKSRGGKLLCPFIAKISSFGGLSYTFSVPYSVGKAGVDHLVKDMVVELTKENVCVVSFYPIMVKME